MTAGGSFGALLRLLRQEAGLSQEALAERAGLSTRGLSDLERGVSRSARPGSTVLLADALALHGPERERFIQAAAGQAISPSIVPGSLPMPATPLIGRAVEAATAESLLSGTDARLVTVSGVGGIGKTRLALEVAARVADRYPDGVWFVDLAPLANAEQVIGAIARTLALGEGSGRSFADAVTAFLGRKRALLVLDNFEHLLAAATDVTTLLERCPAATILVTSRVPLHRSGERVLELPPLRVPRPDDFASFENLQANEAVTLFVERAQAVRVDFALSPDNARAVAEICQRLDGLPLAIELAAARTLLLSPASIVSWLGNRLALLTSGARDLPKRHQTLRNAIDWSYQLLDEAQRAHLRALGVFAGGATLDAALAVCGGRGDASEGTSALAALADWGLVWHEARPNGDARLRMLETIREFALARLGEAGEEPRVRSAHAAYYLELAEKIEPELSGADQAVWLERLDAELDNMRGALTWAVNEGQGVLAMRLAGALWWFWETRGLYAEGQAWLERALAADGRGDLRWRARALFAAGALDYRRRELEGSERRLTEALALFQALDDPYGAALALAFLGLGALVRGDLERAGALHEAALIDARRTGNQVIVAGALSNLGEVAHARGDLARAETLYEESLAVARSVANLLVAARSLTNLGVVAWESGQPRRAAALHRDGLRAYLAVGDRRGIASSLEGVAAVEAAVGQAEAAARFFGAAAALREIVGSPVPVVEQGAYNRGIVAARAQLGEAAVQAAWAAGSSMPLDEAVAEALELRNAASSS